MATGLSTQLTRQIGEHLVTAELGRRGIIATPFAGNVPCVDILAYANGRTVPIQVKAINGTSWQFDIRAFLNVALRGKSQKIDGRVTLDRKILCIFPALGATSSEDQYYVFRLGWLQDYFKTTFKGRKPPKNVNSYHCAIWKRHMTKHLGRWDLVERAFGL